MGRAYEVRKASIQASGAARGKIYTTYAKEIYIEAKRGVPDPDLNSNLKRLINKAKKEQVPNDIINRAIDKAKGNTGEDYHTEVYEGFGPGASTLIIKTLTDNVNRTVGEVRAAFNKVHKSLGVTNSVSYNYDYLGVITFICDNSEKVFDELILNDIDVVEFDEIDSKLTIGVEPTNHNKLKDIIESIYPNVEYLYDEVGMYPKDEVELNEEDLEVFKKLYNMLDNIEDVTTIYHNVKNF